MTLVTELEINCTNAVLDVEEIALLSRLKKITFRSASVPQLTSSYMIYMDSLEEIAVPYQSYCEYTQAFSSIAFPEHAVIIPYDKPDGAADFFIDENGKLIAYAGSDTEVQVPEGVREIGKSVFRNRSDITIVSLPDGVVRIGFAAFQRCTGLQKINLPDTVTVIGDHAFYKCEKLKEIHLPKALEEIEDFAFSCCTSLSGGLDIPSSTKRVGKRSFEQCSGMKGVLRIGAEIIDENAFWGCYGFSSLVILPSVKTIKGAAFYHCYGFEGDLIFPEGVEEIGALSFAYCYGFDGTIYLPNSLTKLSQNAFQDCIKIKGDLIVPEGITTVYDITFENMKCIERIIFPESLIKIGDYNGRVLTNMTSVKEIVFKGTQVPPVRMNEFKTLTSLQTIYVPASALEDYKNAYGSLVNEGVEFKTDTLVLPVSGLKADEVYSRSARISWFPHSSPSVTHYRVLVNNEPAGETEETTWQLSNLTEGESCKVTVTGLTDTGEESASTSMTVIPRSLPVCEIRTSLGSDEVSVTDSTIYGLLDNSEKINPTQIRNLKGAFYYKDGEEEVLIGEAVFNPLLHTSLRIFMETRSDISQLENGSYEVIFRVTDPDGVQSEMTKTITVDRSVPSVIEGVRAEPDVDKILVSWRMAKEANVTTYRIYRRTGETGSFYIIGRVEGRENLTFQDKQVGNTEKYYYYVTAINRIKEESAPSEPAGATLNTDDEAPTMIRMLPKNGTYLTGQIRIELFAEDNVGVSRTRLEISTDNRKTWQSLGQAAGDHGVLSLDTTQYEDGLIYLKAVAEDEAGNVSEPLIYAFSIDNTGPGKPENLSYESTSVSITLRWNDLADQDLSHYEVQQKNAEGEFVTIQDHIQTVGTNINQLNPETEYTFRIRGVDLNGNTGIWSDEIICSTSRDTTRPVITRIRPLSGAYNRLIPFSVRAQDDYSIRTIILQSSVDGRTWTDLTSLDYVEDGAVREWGHSVELDDFEEGSLYLRAVAVDASGNTSDTSSAAPCVQYRIDRTAPAAPEGLMARAQNGAIEISWEQGTEEDLNTYSVYRSTSEDGEYQLLAPGLSTLNYWDRTAQADTLYYYKAAVSDQAGNLSEFSFAVSAQVDPDTEAPVIINTAPSSGERIGTGYRKLRVLASDNRSVASMHLAFSHDGQTWIPGPVIQGKNSARELLEAELSLTDWSDGENMTVQITLEDGAGNTSEPVVLNYVIDKSAPVIVSLQGSYNEEKVTLRWQSGQESDLSGYRIYRKRASASDSSYRLVGQQKADGSLNYVFDDFSISETADDYIYRIEASDDCGNTAQSVTETIHVPDRTNNGLPVPVLNCDAIMEAGVEYIIDASGSTDDSRIVSWHIDFGDGTSSEEASPIHVYEQSGTYTITLTVTDDENNMATLEKTVEVRDVNLAGTARIRFIDEYNIAVPNAPVYFDLGEETQVVKKTDRDGYVTFTADAGRHMVGCLIPNNEWLPAKREMIVSPGTETSIALRLIRYPMLEGSFEVTRMTFEEIEAAGIDLSDSENQHMLQVNVHLTYGKEEINTSFLYNESTGISINRPCVITVGSEQHKTTCYGYKITKPDDPEQYEMAVAILDLPVEATALKEFFDVKLHIINNAASDFVMENNTVTLKVPEGLTIMNAEGYASGAAVSIPSIPCQSQKTVSWMVRGDEVGKYELSADFVGTISQFNQSISAEFVSVDKLKVYGLSDLKLTAEVNRTIENDTFYFDLALTNNGTVDINQASVHLAEDIVQAYLQWEEKDEEGNVIEASKLRDVRVSLLNQILENDQGASISLGKDGVPQRLAPGETLRAQYAAYHVAGFKNDFILEQVISSLAEGYGIDFEIIVKDLVRDSLENAESKVEDIWNNAEKKDLLDVLLDDYSYFYVREALGWKSRYLDLEPDQFYTQAYKQMNLDQVFGDKSAQALCREWIRLLQTDSSWTDTLQNAIHHKRQTILSSALPAWADWLVSQNLLSETGKQALQEKLQTTSGLNLLSSALFESGSEAFLKEIPDLPEWSEEQKQAALNQLNQNLMSALSEQISLFGFLADEDCSWGAIEEVCQLIDRLIELDAAASSSKGLPALLERGLPESVNLGRILASVTTLQNEWWSSKEKSLQDNWNASSMDSQSDAAAIALNLLNREFDEKQSVLKLNAQELYGSAEEDLGDYDMYYTSTLILQTASILSMSLTSQLRNCDLSSLTPESSQEILVMLRSLIRMRVGSERCFSQYAEKAFMDYVYMDLLDRVQIARSAQYKSFNAYYTERLAELMAIKDTLFGAPLTSQQRPEAPEIHIDFEKETTRESLGSEYEYSFDGANWTTGSGKPAPLKPGEISKILWVRKKATDSILSGNITRVNIPARDRLFSDPVIAFDGETYELSGLPAGEYRFGFANTRDDLVLNQTMSLQEGDIHVFESSEYWLFLGVQKIGDESHFDSVTRVISVTIPDSWILDDETMRARGIPAGTSHAEVMEHYAKRHLEAQLTDKEGTQAEIAGTGSILRVNEKDYTVVITGDTSGDGIIDLVDSMQAVDHILGNTVLEEEYLEAGEVTQGEDVSLVDLNAMQNYILTGSFE